MARLALGAIGAAIGGYFGGSTGAQVGFAVGSYLGGVIDPPPGLDGPRLSSLEPMSSSAGGDIGLCYGGMRMPCSVIWARPLEEVAQDSGGKGDSPKVTTFSYFGTFAVAFDAREIAGVRKIWFGTKLVYDASVGADEVTRAGTYELSKFMTIYMGTEDQLPDALIESFEGVGNVPGFRGVAYIVFNRIPLADWGNALPQVMVEPTTSTATTADATSYTPFTIGPWLDMGDGPFHSAGETEYTVDLATDDDGPFTTTSLSAAVANMKERTGDVWGDLYLGYFTDVPGKDKMNRYGEDTGLNDYFGANYVYLCYGVTEPDHFVVDTPDDLAHGYWCSEYANMGYSVGTSSMMWDAHLGANHNIYMLVNRAPGDPLPDGWAVVNICTNYPPEGGYSPSMLSSPVLRIRAERKPRPPPYTCAVGDPCELGIAQVPGTPQVCITCDGELSPNYTYTPVTGSFKQLQAIQVVDGSVVKMPLGPVLLLTDPDAGSSSFWEEAAAAAGVTGAYGVDYPVDVTKAGEADAMLIEVGEGSMVLGDIVADICDRAGLAADQVDVSELDDVVLGFVVDRQMPARNAIEPLRAAYYFDGIESGRTIVFRKRGSDPVAMLTPDDLGATDDGDSAVALVESTNAQESELAATINVIYKARSVDYRDGAVQAQRVTTGSRQVRSIAMPLVLSDAKAAEVPWALLYDEWVGRWTRRWSTSIAYTNLEPGDCVTLVDDDFTYEVMITEKSEEGPVIHWVGRDIDAASYSPNATVIPMPGTPGTVRFDGPMKTEPIDTVLLPSEDDGAHFLVAGAGYRESFRGGRVYRSIDSGVTYGGVADITATATIGYSTTVLGDFHGGNTVDELNSVTLRMHRGELSGITLAAMLNGGNLMLLGDEVLQFMRADLVSSGVYTLSGLLRYRFGTERAAGTHAVNERAVLLSGPGIYRVDMRLADVGLDSTLKGVAFGTALADALEIPFTWSAENLKPLSPINVAALLQPDGSVIVQWDRRSRHPVPWLSSSLLPLGETFEQYRVSILSGSTVVDAVTVTAQSATLHTSGISYSGKTARVQQLSSLVGAGFAAETTIG